MTALILKRVFKLPLCVLKGAIKSLITLMDVPLQSPDYYSSCICKRAKRANIQYRCPARDP